MLEVKSCPAVMHMRKHGYKIARLFHETTRTVNEAICEGTPFAAELLRYCKANNLNASRHRMHVAWFFYWTI